MNKNCSILQTVNFRKALDQTKWNAKSFAVVNTITDVAPLLVIAYAGYQVINGSLSVGTMVAFIAYIERLYGPLRRLVSSSTTLTQSIASMDRMFDLIDEPYEVKDKDYARELHVQMGRFAFTMYPSNMKKLAPQL